jgi:hypothetical protein
MTTTLQFPDEPTDQSALDRHDDEPSPRRAHAHAAHDPTEVAQVIAQRMRDSLATPEQAARDLRRLIADRLGAPTPALRRLGNLDLLFQLVMASPREVLTYDEYEDERERRAAGGEDYPTAATLSKHYGGWDGALTVAERFRDLGGAARTKYTHKQARVHQRSYSSLEIRRAIIRCRQHIGDWPTEYEYDRWGQLARQANAKARVPGPVQVRKAYGSYANALRITREVYERLEARRDENAS